MKWTTKKKPYALSLIGLIDTMDRRVKATPARGPDWIARTDSETLPVNLCFVDVF